MTIARSTTRRGLLAIVALLCPAWLSAQTTSARTATAPSWSFVFTGDLYLVPNSPSFASPVLTADRGWLHLEARYNYEDRATGSFWFGCNFIVGQRLTLEVTPMIAAVVGETAGVAPGYQVALSYGRLSISDTGEYVLNVNDRTASFFYAWPQVAYSLSDWLKVGIAAQRTKVYHTDFDIQRGVLVGFAVGPVEFTSYVFAGKPSPTVVLEGVVSF